MANLFVIIVFYRFLSYVLVEAYHSECHVAAKIESGYICGRWRKDSNGKDYASFRGIPYAKQPLGKLRFQELQPLEPFTEVFDATENGPICPQALNPLRLTANFHHMSEDCIRINIHVPAGGFPGLNENHNRNLIPILVFIHGGSFMHDSGSPDALGPEFLVTKDIILVTFNYRINVPGFLSLASRSIPGNNALRDALTALRWLHRNAIFFGGDPGQVTLGGHSAGATIAHLLSLSPVVKGEGLFKRVIALSGTAVGNYYTSSPNYAKKISTIFLQMLKIDPLKDPEEIHNELIALPIKRLVKVADKLRIKEGPLPFTPVIETPQDNFTTVIPRDPELLLEEENGKEYPMLLGFTSNECVALRYLISDKLLKKLPPALFLMNLLYSTNFTTLDDFNSKIIQQYLNGSTNSVLLKFAPLCSDAFYLYPIIRTTLMRLGVNASPTFIYKFGYSGANPVLRKAFNLKHEGATHSEDLLYIFKAHSRLMVRNELAQSDSDSKMREWMTTIISNFVKTGNPAPLDERSKNLYEDSIWKETDRQLYYQRIYTPMTYDFRPPSESVKQMKQFFDECYRIAKRKVE